jgi:hypothetical protein
MTEPHPERRRSRRNLSILSVRCRVAQGYAPQVWLTDLSAEGCHLVIRAGALKPEQRVVIKAQGMEGLPGVVKWVVDTRAGIEFDRPLHQAVVDHLLEGPIPTRNGSDKPLVDRFGRPVPELPLGSRRSSTGGRRSCL